MVDIYKQGFITQIDPNALTNLALSAKDATAQGKLRAALSALKSLILQVDGKPMVHPDFNNLSRAAAIKIANEIDLISAAITP